MPDSPTRSPRAGVLRPHRPGIGVLHLAGGIVLGVGLATVLGSLFLPWLTSGPATRNSFQLMALTDRIRFTTAWWYRIAPDVWPFWGPAVVLVGVLLLLRLRRSAASGGAAIGVLGVVVGSLVLIYGGGRSVGGVRLAEVGPTVLIVGGALAVIGTGLLLGPSATRLVRTHRA